MQTDDKLLREVFLQKLPSTVRSIVAAQDGKMSLDDTADLADKVHEHLPENISACAASSSSSFTQQPDWEKRMSRLETMMEKLMSPRDRSSDCFNSQYRKRSTSRGKFNPNGKLCYYHWRYKEKAEKCNQPCSWKPRSDSPISKNA